MFRTITPILDSVKSFLSRNSKTVRITNTQSDFHDFMDKLNRLPRFGLLLGIIGVFVWPVFDPKQFTEWAIAITHIPENMWVIIILVLSSWATTKFIRDCKTQSPNHLTDTSQVLDTQSRGRFDNLNYDDEILDETPEPNDTIEGWKQNASKRD